MPISAVGDVLRAGMASVSGLFGRFQSLGQPGQMTARPPMSQGADRPIPVELAYPEVMEAIGARLAALVALEMYALGLPLDHVKAADPSGMVAAAIEALAADMLADEQRQEAEAATEAHAAGTFGPHTTSFEQDAVFYDQVRRLATQQGLAIDEMTDLEALAKQNGWTPETIAETLASVEEPW